MSRLLLTLVLAVFATPLLGEGKRYTLEDCIELALKNGAAAKTAALEEAIAGARVKQARSVALPKLLATAKYTRLDELQEIDFDGELLEVGTLNNYAAGVEVSQLLFSGGKVGAALRAASITGRQAAAVRAEAESEVRRTVTHLFNEILLSRARIEVLEESLALLEGLVKQTEARRAEGKASEFDILSARVRFENERPQLIQAKNALAVLHERMAKLTGTNGGGFVLDGSLIFQETECDEAALMAEAMESRPLVRASQEMGLLRKQGVTATRADQLPSLSVFASYSGANSYGFVSFEDEEWEWHWNAGLALSWNFWDGGMTRGLLYEKKLEYQKALVALEDTENEVELQVKTALLGIDNAAEAVKAAEGNVVLAEKAMEIASTRHEEGMSTYLDYTEANVELKRARLAFLSSVAAHLNAVADLKHAVGRADLPKEDINGDTDESE